MIHKRGTLITNRSVEVSNNLFRNKEWPLFDYKKIQTPLASIPNLSMKSFILELTPNAREAWEFYDKRCAEFAYNECIKKFFNSDMSMYLFICPSSWMKDTKLNRYKRIWRYLEELQIDGIRLLSEEVYKSKFGIRYAITIEISEVRYSNAIKFLRKGYCSIIFFLNRRITNHTATGLNQTIYKHSFPEIEKYSSINLSNVTASLCPEGFSFIRIWGGFDDTELSLDLIYDPINGKVANCK